MWPILESPWILPLHLSLSCLLCSFNINLLAEFESISIFYFAVLFFLDSLSMCVGGGGCVYAWCVCGRDGVRVWGTVEKNRRKLPNSFLGLNSAK